MIRHLQRMRAKKGFSMIELIVVVAIIGILIAVIVPNVGNDRAKREQANTTATDFYSAVQYCFSKYSKYEAALSPELKADIPSKSFIDYFPAVSGNYPVNKVTYIKMKNGSDGKIEYVHVASSLSDLLADTTTTNTNAFADLLAKDIGDMFYSELEGCYFAYVYFADASTALASTTNTVRVKMTHFMYEDMPSTATVDSAFINNNLLFTDYAYLANNRICGTCSSIKSGSVYLGDVGTYFLNKGDEVTA